MQADVLDGCPDNRQATGVIRFFLLDTGIVFSLWGFESMERSLPKEESMPVLSALAKSFYYLPFTQYSGWHRDGYQRASDEIETFKRTYSIV